MAAPIETVDGSSSRVVRRRTRKVQEILRAASDVIAERGYQMASLDDIADRLDLTKASLYHYFPSKDELLLACLEMVANDVISRLEDAASKPFASQRARLSALIVVQLDGVVRIHPQLAAFFLHPPDLPTSLQRRTKELRRRHDNVFRRVVEDGVLAGEFDLGESKTAAMNNFYGAMNFGPQWLTTRSKRAFDEAAASMAENLILLFAPTGRVEAAAG